MKSVGFKFYVTLAIFIAFFAFFLFYSHYSLFENHTTQLINQQTEIASHYNLAVRKYVAEYIRPALYKLLPPDEFQPETMSSSYVARTVFEDVQKVFPGFILKFSSTNPRNPVNKASPEEEKMIDYFNNNPQAEGWSGPINIDGKPYIARFHPQRMKEGCLSCHGEPSDAPKSLRQRYGSVKGFHYPLNKVIALDTVAIPITNIKKHIWRDMVRDAATISVGTFLLFAAMVLSFRFLILNRLALITNHFKKEANHGEDAEIKQINITGSDEISTLALSFNEFAGRINESSIKLKKEIADRQKAEEELQKIKDNLADLVEERTEELACVNEQLEKEAAQHKQTAEKYQEQGDFLRKVIDALPHPFYVIDVNDYTIKMANEVMGLLDLSKKPTCHQVTHHRDTPCDSAEHPCGVQEVRRTGEPTVLEHVHYDKDGSQRDYEVHSVPLFDSSGQVYQVIEYSLDVTEKNNANRALEEAKKAAEEGSRAKSEFLANMSHEIRTPLNGIMGMTDLVLEKGLPPDQQNFLQLARESADRLLGVINDILDFSKVEAGKLELESISFALRPMLGETMKLLAVKAQEKGLELLYHVYEDVPDYLIGDPGRLRQVLNNLVGNAIKFTDQGEVVVSVEMKEDMGPEKVELHFSVMDTGIGISEENQELIFEAFSQADASMTRKYGGTGLGLTICSQLVNKMDGEIWLDSKPDKGAVFNFTAVFDKQLYDPFKEELSSFEELRNISALIVSDNTSSRLVLKDMLKRFLGEIDAASDSEAALAALKQKSFKIVLLDAQEKGGDGFALAEKIVADKDVASAKIIMLAAIGQRGDAAGCRQLGVACYLTKPVGQSELLQAIRAALGRGDQPQEVPELITRHSLKENVKDFHILLVEDEFVNRTVAGSIIEQVGWQLTAAENGQEALDALENGNFDLILMDVQMPVMDGIEATITIRQKEEETGGHIPIIALTAHAVKGDREHCLEVGMDDYVSKPIKKEEFLATIEKWLYEAGKKGQE